MEKIKKINQRKQKQLYAITCALEDGYDAKIPMAARLRNLGEALSKTSGIFSIDKELLALVASTRWLMRSKSRDLAIMTISRYKGLSYLLTDGKSPDVLGVAGDLISGDSTSEE